MIWFWVVVLVVVIGTVAVVAAGRGDAMADVYEDRPDMALERGRRLTAADVRAVRFTTAVRGYRMDEVDAFVARMEAELLAGGHSADAADGSRPARDGGGGEDLGEQPAGERVDGAHAQGEDPQPGDDAYADDEAGAGPGDGTEAPDRT
ncbi:MAG: DivIVA domain-containing protein [Nocardioidaceae bacterium]|nr:DivIVA domain-containing protein [Nocardioidaceae bacterium]